MSIPSMIVNPPTELNYILIGSSVHEIRSNSCGTAVGLDIIARRTCAPVLDRTKRWRQVKAGTSITYAH